MRTLLLTSGYEPFRTIPWQRAIMLLYLDKAELIAGYPGRILRSPRIGVPMPAVIRLRQWVRPSRRVRVPFSRRNIYVRDQWMCQYCGLRPIARLLTLDHVLPRSRGGETSWTNVVTACQSCNATKAGRTPAEAGMHLRTRPARPQALPWTPPVVSWAASPIEWEPYLAPFLANGSGS